MTDHNLDDLIIGEPDLHGGKSKSVLTTLALIAIVVIVGIVLYQIIMGGDETAQITTENHTNLTSVVTHPVQRETMTRRREKIPEELQPIVREKLPVAAEQHVAPPRTHPTPEKESPTRQTLARKSDSVTARGPKPHAKIPAATPRHTAIPRPVTHTPQKTKPSELFKRKKPVKRETPPTTAGTKEYFVQVGSFKRPPTKKFLDDMRAKGYRPILVKSAGMIKVRVGPYSSYTEAKAKLPEIKEKLGIAGFVVRKK